MRCAKAAPSDRLELHSPIPVVADPNVGDWTLVKYARRQDGAGGESNDDEFADFGAVEEGEPIRAEPASRKDRVV